MMSNTEDSVETDDMALSAYLQMKRQVPTEISYDEDTGVVRWIFSGDNAVDEATEYLKNEVLVKPRAFVYYYKVVKQQIYDAKAGS